MSPGNIWGKKDEGPSFAPGREGAVVPTPWGKTFFWCCSNNAHIVFIILCSYRIVNTLIEYIFLYNMILWVSVSANPSYPKCPSPLEGPSCPMLRRSKHHRSQCHKHRNYTNIGASHINWLSEIEKAKPSSIVTQNVSIVCWRCHGDIDAQLSTYRLYFSL